MQAYWSPGRRGDKRENTFIEWALLYCYCKEKCKWKLALLRRREISRFNSWDRAAPSVSVTIESDTGWEVGEFQEEGYRELEKDSC